MRKQLVIAALTVLGVVATATPALALPNEQPDSTWMVNGTVRSIAQVGSVIWIGGKFTELRSAPSGGTVIQLNGLAAVDAVAGAPIPGVHIPRLGGVPTPIGYDLSFSFGDGRLYVGGKFSTVDGAVRRNIAAIDPVTGNLLPFKAKSAGLRAVLAAPSGGVYAGGPQRLDLFMADGVKAPGFTPLVPTVAPDSPNGAGIRDVDLAPDGAVFVAGAFDFLNGDAHHAVAKVDAATGEPTTWALGGFVGSAALGNDLYVDGANDALYTAIGGSDYAGRYRASDGALIWKTDTSGAAQGIALFSDGASVIVGGHYQWVAPGPGTECGSNSNPSGNCIKRLRLAALNASTGLLEPNWTPDITPQYFGIYTILVDGSRLHLGGDFGKIEGVPQTFYGRLS